MGAKIQGAGTPRITIEGVDQLGGTDHTVMADRIEAGTFMIAAAITNGDLVLDNCPIDAMLAPIYWLQAAGVHVQPVASLAAAGVAPMGRARGAGALSLSSGAPASASGIDDPLRKCVRITTERVLRPVEITTQPHPGFPTDLQAQLMALLCLADGNSVVTERIFQDRFLHVAELSRMGGRLVRQGPTVIISGVRELVGAPVMASDLRASACLVLAGLAAKGRTVVNRVYHLDRGYERMEERLRSLGASISRVEEKAAATMCTVAV
jgi:UDP-N-acetylglucosamine 1-carboxyvinyltransferase